MKHLLHQTCRVLRYQEVTDEYNTPTDDDWIEVGQYPCRLSRKNLALLQGQYATEVRNVYTLFLEAGTDIKAGDLVEVDGLKYRAAEPYRPGGHHVEVTITYEGEV